MDIWGPKNFSICYLKSTNLWVMGLYEINKNTKSRSCWEDEASLVLWFRLKVILTALLILSCTCQSSSRVALKLLSFSFGKHTPSLSSVSYFLSRNNVTVKSAHFGSCFLENLHEHRCSLMAVVFKERIYYWLCAKCFIEISAWCEVELNRFFIISKKHCADGWYHKAGRSNIENFYPLKESYHKN